MPPIRALPLPLQRQHAQAARAAGYISPVSSWSAPIQTAPLATQQAHAQAARAAGYINPVVNVMPTLTGDRRAVMGAGAGPGRAAPAIPVDPYASIMKAVGNIMT